ncbi:hypothetical protein [Mycobacterium antarcticum]|uniref:hypothetical protein n=1 Tax=Mycolicibacterium sp. TUM20983 TaxID=3023369 RepID=UPI0024E17524|nr:hypothetical protein [Mycolicibacterium sp. TUM20983]
MIGALLFRLLFVVVGAELLAPFFSTAYLLGDFFIDTRTTSRTTLSSNPNATWWSDWSAAWCPPIPDIMGIACSPASTANGWRSCCSWRWWPSEPTDTHLCDRLGGCRAGDHQQQLIVWTANAFAVLGLGRQYASCLGCCVASPIALRIGRAAALPAPRCRTVKRHQRGSDVIVDLFSETRYANNNV